MSYLISWHAPDVREIVFLFSGLEDELVLRVDVRVGHTVRPYLHASLVVRVHLKKKRQSNRHTFTTTAFVAA